MHACIRNLHRLITNGIIVIVFCFCLLGTHVWLQTLFVLILATDWSGSSTAAVKADDAPGAGGSVDGSGLGSPTHQAAERAAGRVAAVVAFYSAGSMQVLTDYHQLIHSFVYYN